MNDTPLPPVLPLRSTLEADDGHPIELLRWLPAGPPRAVVQIAHGMGEHAGRYARLAQALVAAGHAVYANQHRGHGEAAAAAAALGDFGPGGFPAVVADLVRVSLHAKAQHPDTPLLLLGHSMGSFAAQAYLLDRPDLPAGVALSGTAATDLLAAGRSGEFRLEDSNRGIAQPRTPFDWLSRDAGEVDKYIADPLCGFTVDAAGLRSIFDCCARTAAAGAFRSVPPSLPVYLFTGSRDPVNRDLAWFHPLVQRLADAGLTDVRTRVYPDARHEVLNETNRDEVTRDFLAWIDHALSHHPKELRA